MTRIAALARAPELPGAQALEGRRAELLGRAKAEPVVFVRVPSRGVAPTPEVAHYWAQLDRARAPALALRELYPSLHRRPDVARATLLREGYLYAESPALGVELVMSVKLEHLFTAPEVLVQRGDTVSRALLRGREYVYADGARAGERVSLLLFDRVWSAGAEPGPPLHRTLTAVLDASGADRVRLTRLADAGALAELRLGTVWVPALLTEVGARYELGCLATPATAESEVQRARALATRRRRALAAQRVVMEAMVAEALPFDEPKTEEGQQDGNLRPQWKWAYDHGWDVYRFNDDTYRVFDRQGRPHVPQVCIDFILDTFERASGTWWTPRDTTRTRVVGKLDFGRLALENRRSVEQFVDFAWAHPEWFDVLDLPDAERIPFQRREEFFAHLAEHADRYQPGDIVTIHGYRGGDGQMHYHSFFVVAADPVTGAPTTVAANAGQPRIRTWEQEMGNAPRRSLRTRIRPRLEWLEAHLEPPESVTLAAPSGPAAPPG